MSEAPSLIYLNISDATDNKHNHRVVVRQNKLIALVETYSDMTGEIVNFFKVLCDKKEKLSEMR